MKKKCYTFFLLIIIQFIFTSNSQSIFHPLPKNDYQIGTLGHGLQPAFRSHCGSCGILKKKQLEKNRDFIVWDIKNSWEANQGYIDRNVYSCKSSLHTIFSHIFADSETEIENIYNSTDGIDILESTNYQKLLTPSEYESYTLYSKDCKGYHGASLSGKVKLPKFAAKAAYEADSRNSSLIVLKRGRFINPIKLLIEKNDLTTLYLIWDYYLNNQNRIERGIKYLREIEGVMIINETKFDKNDRFKGEASLKLNSITPSASIQSKLGVERTVNEIFESEETLTFIFKSENQNLLTSDYPTKEEIQRRIAAIVQPEFITGDRYYSKDSPYTHKVALKGLPEKMVVDYWDLVLTEEGEEFYLGKPDILSEIVKEDNSIIFTIVGKTNPKNFESNLPFVKLGYKFQSKRDIDGIRLETKEFVKPIETSRHPQIEIVGTPDLSVSDVGNNSTQQNWTINFRILDQANLINLNSGVLITDIKIFKGDNIFSTIFTSERFTHTVNNNFSSIVKSKKLYPSSALTYNDEFELELTIEMLSKDNETIYRTGRKRIPVKRLKDGDQPSISLNPINQEFSNPNSDKSNFRWNYDLEIYSGDTKINLNESTQLILNPIKIIGGEAMIDVGTPELILINSTKNVYELSIPTIKEFSTNYPLIRKDVLLEGALVFQTNNQKFNTLNFSKELSMRIPYSPEINITNTNFNISLNEEKSEMLLEIYFSIQDPFFALKNSDAFQIKQVNIVQNENLVSFRIQPTEKIKEGSYKLTLIPSKGNMQVHSIDPANNCQIYLKIEFQLEDGKEIVREYIVDCQTTN